MATQDSIAHGNHFFFVVDFPNSLFCPNSKIEGAIWKSLWEGSTLCGVPGLRDTCHYLRTTFSFSRGDRNFSALTSRFRKDFFSGSVIQRLPEQLYMNRWFGKNDEVAIQIESWKFEFRIVGYERDIDHDFARIERPWEDDSVLDDEMLNRIAELRISPY